MQAQNCSIPLKNQWSIYKAILNIPVRREVRLAQGVLVVQYHPMDTNTKKSQRFTLENSIASFTSYVSGSHRTLSPGSPSLPAYPLGPGSP